MGKVLAQGHSAWTKHWGAERWGHLYVHGTQRDSEKIVNKIITEIAKGVLMLTRSWARVCPWRSCEGEN